MIVRLEDGVRIDTTHYRYMGADVDRHDNVRVFVRRHGRKPRIRDWSSATAFLAEYHRLLDGEAKPAKAQPIKSGSLRALIAAYLGAPEFLSLAQRTRTVRRAILDQICQERFRLESMHGEPMHGDKPAALMQPKHVRTIRDVKATRPEAANDRMKALRAVYGWGVEAGHVETNPARDVPYLRPATEGHHTWTEAEVAQFQAHHPVGSTAHLALALLLYTGVRRSDVVRLGPQMERDGHLNFTEAKGQSRKIKAREVPIIPALRAVLDASPSGHLNFMVTAFGKPFTPNGFGNWFKKRCREAGLPHCSAHGLRKAGATIAAENGATEHQLMALYGWESPKQAALYTRKADRKRLAGQAARLLDPPVTVSPARPEIGQSVPLSEVVMPGGTKRGKKS